MASDRTNLVAVQLAAGQRLSGYLQLDLAKVWRPGGKVSNQGRKPAKTGQFLRR
jgi:hypothetical protein